MHAKYTTSSVSLYIWGKCKILTSQGKPGKKYGQEILFLSKRRGNFFDKE
jgi:hypothetical protein